MWDGGVKYTGIFKKNLLLCQVLRKEGPERDVYQAKCSSWPSSSDGVNKISFEAGPQ